jgi:hypothetical protein
MKRYTQYIIVGLFVSVCHSFQTSSESVNPYNQFMALSGWVNIYSCDVAYSQPVTSISGRGGMNINIALAYSSNIYLNVRSRNDVAPTSWVGLGWELTFGSIICNHKVTKTHDDDFLWISPAGFGRNVDAVPVNQNHVD